MTEKYISLSSKATSRSTTEPGSTGLWLSYFDRDEATESLRENMADTRAKNWDVIVTSVDVPTRAGWLYLAVVLDAWSRRIVGWAMAPHMRAEMVEGALAMAISRRRTTRD